MDTMPDPARERLTLIRNGLLRLHKNLLDSERNAYERDVARINSTGQYLDLVLNDPWFAWLRELSKLVVAIDEMLDRKEPPMSDAEAAALIGDSRKLIAPSENSSGFGRRYFEAMQRDAGIVLAHRDMIRLFDTETQRQ
jgi:hypothetical protein